MHQDVIGIVAPANLKYLPYFEYYATALKNANIPYKVMSWNKSSLKEDVDFAFDYPVNDSNRKKMMLGYLKFARACKRYIRKEGIRKLVVLTAAPAFFLGLSFLKKRSYILDIRDDSPLIRRFPKHFHKLCSAASMTVVSSPKFNAWMPKDGILCHNADVLQIEKYFSLPPKQKKNGPCSIVFAGMMIESEMNIDILRRMKGDARFSFGFIGRPNEGKERIVRYAAEEKMDNVFFEGTYKKEEIVDIYREKADLINIFRAKTTVNKNALPNKLYDAVISAVPLVVFSHNEAISDYVKAYSLGISLDEKDLEDLPTVLAAKMEEFDYEKYMEGRAAFLQAVLDDMSRFTHELLAFAEEKELP